MKKSLDRMKEIKKHEKELENYPSDLLGVRVDLVEKFALKPRIGKRILSEVV